MVASLAGGIGATALSGLGQSLINLGVSAYQGHKARKAAWDMLKYQTNFAEKQAQQQMAFQERMSSTAHQREVTDLKAAGLNPVLSANNGASSPVGAMANITMPEQSPEEKGIGAFNASRMLNAQIKNINSLNDLQDKQANNAVAQTAKTLADTDVQQYYLENIQPVEKAIADANNAKILQDIENSKVITQAEVENLKSNINYNNARSLAIRAEMPVRSNNAYRAGQSEAFIRKHPMLLDFRNTVDAFGGVRIPDISFYKK